VLIDLGDISRRFARLRSRNPHSALLYFSDVVD
jgi:hypothetical protein